MSDGAVHTISRCRFSDPFVGGIALPVIMWRVETDESGKIARIEYAWKLIGPDGYLPFLRE